MCSAPAVKQVVNTTARAVSGVLTLGGSEVARNNLSSSNPINKVLNAPGEIFTGGTSTIPKVAVGLGLVKPDVPQPPPPPEDVTGAGDEPPTPGMVAPGTTTVDSLASRRRKKLTALQRGLLSTIATSGAGLTGGANVLTPSAGGTTGKSLLGV